MVGQNGIILKFVTPVFEKHIKTYLFSQYTRNCDLVAFACGMLSLLFLLCLCGKAGDWPPKSLCFQAVCASVLAVLDRTLDVCEQYFLQTARANFEKFTVC